MADANDLITLGATPGSLWGDEAETIVYAQASGNGQALIFRFSQNPAKSPHALSNRIVNCFHVIDEDDIKSTFASRSDMRKAIWSAVAKAWTKCVADEKNLKPGVIVDINTNDAGDVTWKAAQDPLFEKYLEFMRGVQSSDLAPEGQSPSVIDISEVVVLDTMSGRGGAAKLARLRTDTAKSTPFIFKGIDFQTYLQVHDEEGEFSSAMLETWKRASRLIAGMTPHPNIQPPPKYLVSVTGSSGNPTLIGHLSPFSSKGFLSTVVEAANESETQIGLQQKARWCHQMSVAVAHTHNVLKTYHMDIQPQNFLVDEKENLLLVDWEQKQATAATLAPEADGTRDVKENGSKLVYTEYDGPERSNMPEDGVQNGWNVFPEWQANFPRATELAEVFSLGRTMWMLLSQEDVDFDEIEHPDDVEVVWGETGVPGSWTKMVDRCMQADSNKRPSLTELVKFWEEEVAKLAGSA